ncbi:MAG: RNHCP domain-containing protein [Anaerolineae bacterium]|nr:RNHCP domain-containing protein [Anaerolineae bacterium]
MSRKFQKRIEDFICENCGQKVTGSGYTNHCPACLWSKHVDIHPGDREEKCGGMMPPVSVSQRRSEYRILHRCQTCGKEKWNKSVAEDDFDRLLAIIRSDGGGAW